MIGINEFVNNLTQTCKSLSQVRADGKKLSFYNKLRHLFSRNYVEQELTQVCKKLGEVKDLTSVSCPDQIQILVRLKQLQSRIKTSDYKTQCAANIEKFEAMILNQDTMTHHLEALISEVEQDAKKRNKKDLRNDLLKFSEFIHHFKNDKESREIIVSKWNNFIENKNGLKELKKIDIQVQELFKRHHFISNVNKETALLVTSDEAISKAFIAPDTSIKRKWIERASEVNPSLKSTYRLISSPDRRKIHEEIKSQIIGEIQPVPKDKKPVALIMMGPAGSGKSTCIHHILKNKNEFVEVGTDNVMERIPEYQQAINLGRDPDGCIITAKDAWAITKDEAASLTADLRQRVIESRRNMIYDATGQNLHLYESMIKQLKGKGYDVQVYYHDVDLEKTKERVKNRAEAAGRFISDNAQQETYYASRRNFRKIAALADTAVLLDNRETFPPKTAARYNKGKLQEGQEYLKARKF